MPFTLPLCLLAGYLFHPTYLALLMVCTASATGATGAYFLSRAIGKDLVCKAFPQRIKDWEARVRFQAIASQQLWT